MIDRREILAFQRTRIDRYANTGSGDIDAAMSGI